MGKRSTKKNIRTRENLNEKKNSCTPIKPKKYSCYALKTIHTKYLITIKKIPAAQKFAIPLPPPPDNISNNPSLKKIVPASVVAISNYNLYRRDRNWFDNDKREKGGVEIYVRKNLKVKRVVRSYFFESISLENDLPSGHRMLTCGIYQPNSKYPE